MSSDVPFVEGGHRKIVRALVRALKERGIEAEACFTPQNPFGKQIKAYISNMFTDLRKDGLGGKIDGVVAFRYPSYCVRANKKVIWLNHRMREYYDLWEKFKSGLSEKGRIKEEVRRRIIEFFDRRCLSKVNKLFAQSSIISERLWKWGKLRSEVLYPPPPQRNYRNVEYGNYFFFPSRLTKLKRQEIAIRAMKFVKGAKLVLAGDGEERQKLNSLVERESLKDRIVFTGFVSDNELVELYSKALAVIFIPYMEDFGFVTIEALYSGKPVFVFTDSGGAKELIKNGRNGFILEPSPETLAERMNLLVNNRRIAEDMGREGEKIRNEINWDRAVEKLIEAFK